MVKKLGLDLGNVIIDHLGFGTDEAFFKYGDYTLIPPLNGVIECLAKISLSGLFEDIFVVYNATNVADEKIKQWLTKHEFCQRTGIPDNNISRSAHGRNKLFFCQEHDITHFVDDRMEVLHKMIGHIPHLYLLNSQEAERSAYLDRIHEVNVVDNWPVLTLKILK